MGMSMELGTSATSQLPPFPILMLDVLVSFGSVFGTEPFGVPIQFLADAIGDITEKSSFRERTGVIEIARGRPTGFARLDPFQVMADRVLDKRFGTHETVEVLFGQQNVLTVIRHDHALFADEKYAAF